jgi:predicted DNA binding CopG/RHH family protein
MAAAAAMFFACGLCPASAGQPRLAASAVREMIRTEGADKAVRRLFEDRATEGALLNGIGTGGAGWLRVAHMKKANRKRKALPAFESESAERSFWLVHDSADYFDLGTARRVVFPILKPTTRTISLRIPETLLAEIKVLANQRDVPYQSLMKIFLAERVTRERKK